MTIRRPELEAISRTLEQEYGATSREIPPTAEAGLFRSNRFVNGMRINELKFLFVFQSFSVLRRS